MTLMRPTRTTKSVRVIIMQYGPRCFFCNLEGYFKSQMDRKVKLKPNQAAVAMFRTRNLNELSNDRQVCLVPNPNIMSSAILGRSFSLTQSGLCVSVLLNTEATTVTIQRGKKLGYALPLNTDFQSVEHLKKFDVTECPMHANQVCIRKRINELKSSKKLFSMKSETDDGLSSCSNYPERPTETELAANKHVLPEIEHLKYAGMQTFFRSIRPT